MQLAVINMAVWQIMVLAYIINIIACFVVVWAYISRLPEE